MKTGATAHTHSYKVTPTSFKYSPGRNALTHHGDLTAENKHLSVQWKLTAYKWCCNDLYEVEKEKKTFAEVL